MSAALERAARRLAALSVQEREWVLARLAPADAQRLQGLLEPHGAADAPERPAEPAAPADASPAARVERAGAAEVAKALREEPDWLVALVLARRRWPWDRELVAGLGAARAATLGELARAARAGARPQACEAAVAALAAALGEAPKRAAAGPFDELLTAMQQQGDPT